MQTSTQIEALLEDFLKIFYRGSCEHLGRTYPYPTLYYVCSTHYMVYIDVITSM